MDIITLTYNMTKSGYWREPHKEIERNAAA